MVLVAHKKLQEECAERIWRRLTCHEKEEEMGPHKGHTNMIWKQFSWSEQYCVKKP